MKVFAVCHNRPPVAMANYVIPVHAGACAAEKHVDTALRDDTGENISHKNKHYAELTALYWIWKNADDSMLGLCHYRRLWSPFMTPYSEPIIWAPPTLAQDILSVDPIGRIFQCELTFADILVPLPVQFDRSLEQQFYYHHRVEDWAAAMDAIDAVYPQEGPSARKFFAQSRLFYGYNMFIAKKQVFQSYCSWLFPLIEEMERRITPSEDPYQSRVFGFISERMFCWWLRSRTMKMIEKPIVVCQ